SSQTVTDSREYDSWGLVIASAGSTTTPFKFAGGHGYQADADSGLMLLGARCYDASGSRLTRRRQSVPASQRGKGQPSRNHDARASGRAKSRRDRLAVFTCVHVARQAAPIIGVWHSAPVDPADSGWSFPCGAAGHADEDILVVAMGPFLRSILRWGR